MITRRARAGDHRAPLVGLVYYFAMSFAAGALIAGVPGGTPFVARGVVELAGGAVILALAFGYYRAELRRARDVRRAREHIAEILGTIESTNGECE